MTPDDLDTPGKIYSFVAKRDTRLGDRRCSACYEDFKAGQRIWVKVFGATKVFEHANCEVEK